jgi:hypothetical protein
MHDQHFIKYCKRKKKSCAPNLSNGPGAGSPFSNLLVRLLFYFCPCKISSTKDIHLSLSQERIFGLLVSRARGFLPAGVGRVFDFRGQLIFASARGAEMEYSNRNCMAENGNLSGRKSIARELESGRSPNRVAPLYHY